MPIVKLNPVHNKLLDLLVERVNRYQAELFNEVQVILADLNVPPGSYDPRLIIQSREVTVADPPTTSSAPGTPNPVCLKPKK